MNLSNVINTPDVLREVAIQNSKFDLFEFYDRGKDSGHLDGACGFISRRQYFYCFADDYHSLVFENVGSSLYDDDSMEYNAYYEVFSPYYHENSTGKDYCNDAWRYANGDFGLISIQLLSKKECFVWFPEKINSFQKLKLLEFFREMKQINDYLRKSGFPEINVFVSVMKDHEYGLGIEMDDFISQIDNYVDDNCFCPYERNISDYQISKHV